jgi:hypothetical protein
LAKEVKIMTKPDILKHPNITIDADATVVPCADSKGETHRVTLATFPDHGTTVYVASTIGSRHSLVQAAAALSLADSLRLDTALIKITGDVLRDGEARSDAVLTTRTKEKPDIQVAVLGNPYNETSLRLYFHIGVYEGAVVVYQDARARTKDAGGVEKTFRQEAGYTPPKNWGEKKRG